MYLIQVKLIEGLLTGPQQQELLARLTDALLTTAGESARHATWCVVEETPAGRWGIGGETLALDDVRAMARDAEGGSER
jgi:4-oxalocrotonate tautomerase family enzyme